MPTQQPILFDITLDDITSNCGKVFTARGREYQRNGQVLEVEWITESTTLNAKVAGSSALPYTQTIKAEDTFIDGVCSCPVGYNCKHVAAVLLHWLSQRSGGPQPTRATEQHISQWRDRLLRISAQSYTNQQNRVFPGEEMLLYQLRQGHQYNSLPGINVDITKTRLLKKGGFGKEATYRYQADYLFPRWMTPIDREILTIALACRDRYNYKPLSLEGHLAVPLLQKIVQSGRGYWAEQRDTTLSLGKPRKLELQWQMEADNRFALQASLEDTTDDWLLIPAAEPWYLDTDHHIAGPITTDLETRLLQELLGAPRLTLEQAQDTANHFALHLADKPLPLPVAPAFEAVETTPVPVLVLRSLQTDSGIDDYFASLHFLYAEHQLPFEGDESAITEKHNADGNTIIIRRNLALELEALVLFNRQCPGFAPASDRDAVQFSTADRMPRLARAPAVAAEWRSLIHSLPTFRAAGWQIQQHDSFNLTFTETRALNAQIKEDKRGWFDVALTLQVGDRQYELLPLISEWLNYNDPSHAMIVAGAPGQWLEIPQDVLEPAVRLLLELFEDRPNDTTLRLPRQRAPLITELDDEFNQHDVAVRWVGDSKLRQLSHDLLHLAQQPLPDAPEGLNATLRDYQRAGLRWLQFLRIYGFNGILADDMGLGKTLQTLAHLLIEHHSGRLRHPALIVAPTSVLGNWRKEANRFTPALKCLVLHGSTRHDDFDRISEQQLVITSYQLLLRDIASFQQMKFDYLVLDEAQMIKNPSAKITQAARSLEVAHRLCLTGTPMENHLGELWSLFDFLMPGYLGNRKQFTRIYQTPIERHHDMDKQTRLNKVISMFLLRRNKEQVAAELPPKTTIVREVELGPRQARLYESIRISMEQRVRELIGRKGAQKSHIEILDALLKLRQTCCHPQLVKLENARSIGESAKTELLLDMIEELIAENKKILLFSQFTEMLALVETELNKRAIPYVTLTGRTRHRDVVIDRFQHGEIPLFLISLKAGGTGLNLTAADTVIHYDPWWNPAVENQASDRAHRIGQHKPVFVYKLVAKNTVEEKIMQLQQKKQQLANNTYNHDGSADPFQKLSTDDILQLFNPD